MSVELSSMKNVNGIGNRKVAYDEKHQSSGLKSDRVAAPWQGTGEALHGIRPSCNQSKPAYDIKGFPATHVTVIQLGDPHKLDETDAC